MPGTSADGSGHGPDGGERPAVRRVEVQADLVGERLDRFLMGLLPDVPKSRIYRSVRRGEVRVNGGRAAPEQRLKLRDVVRVPPLRAPREPASPEDALPPPPAGPAILFEDPGLLVLDKPAGSAVHGGVGLAGGVIDALRAARPGEYLELAHRLDRDTSGCLLVARSPDARDELDALFRRGGVEKRYTALLGGALEGGPVRVDAPLRTDQRRGGERTVKVGSGGKPALSEFTPERVFARRATLVGVLLETGRMHQIRVHSAYLGHPVAGDAKYGDRAFNARMRELGLRRMFLHARSVTLEWPAGEMLRVTAPLPPELVQVLARLDEAERAP